LTIALCLCPGDCGWPAAEVRGSCELPSTSAGACGHPHPAAAPDPAQLPGPGEALPTLPPSHHASMHDLVRPSCHSGGLAWRKAGAAAAAAPPLPGGAAAALLPLGLVPPAAGPTPFCTGTH